MKRRRHLLASGSALVALVALVALAALGDGAAAVTPPARTVDVSCRSPSLGGTLPARVYLPAGYGSSGLGAPYPVVYFLHGLPAGPTTYRTTAFVAGAVAAAGERAIVVTPQGARDDDSDREYLDWGPGENWPRAVADDLTACVDARFHTIADRDGRALIGLSAGGYGAFNIGLRNLREFAAVESWSGYFAATDPSGQHVLNLGSPQANSAATVPSGPLLRRALGAWPALLAFYVGRQDTRFVGMNRAFDAALTRSGVSAHVPRLRRRALGRAVARASPGVAGDGASLPGVGASLR